MPGSGNVGILKVKVMKKIIISLAAIFLLLFISCYNENRNATLRINLGNIPVANNIEKKSVLDWVFSFFMNDVYAQTITDNYSVDILHIGIYSGKNLVYKKSINGNEVEVSGNNSYVELEVPEGTGFTVLALGEYNSVGRYANYYGYNSVSLPAGADVDVTINMTYATWDGTVPGRMFISNPSCGPAPYTMTWTPAGVPVRYLIIDNSGASPVIKFSGNGTEYIDNTSNSYEFYVEFEDFDLRTNTYYINNC